MNHGTKLGEIYIRELLTRLEHEDDYRILQVWDTEEYTTCNHVEAAMEAITAVEEATVYLKHKDPAHDPITHWIFFIAENGEDAVVDCHYNEPFNGIVTRHWDAITDGRFLVEKLVMLDDEIDKLNELVAYYREPRTMQ